MAQGRHKSPKVLGKCVKRTMRQFASNIRKRYAARTESGQLSECAEASFVGMVQSVAAKCLKTLDRVKGIEPSSSAWKAIGNPHQIKGCLDFSHA